ncbi:MAG TPA: hypothetical protein ENH40_05330 [Nitrospirae bacterium]|nr:hypothetical protein [Nitrospirota bacterium]
MKTENIIKTEKVLEVLVHSPTPCSTTGIRGCSAMTKRKGTLRHCAQRAIYTVRGNDYCWYHHPDKGRIFGSGYKNE